MFRTVANRDNIQCAECPAQNIESFLPCVADGLLEAIDSNLQTGKPLIIDHCAGWACACLPPNPLPFPKRGAKSAGQPVIIQGLMAFSMVKCQSYHHIIDMWGMVQEEQKGREAAETSLQEAQENFKTELASSRERFRANLASQSEAIQSAQSQLQVSNACSASFAHAPWPQSHPLDVFLLISAHQTRLNYMAAMGGTFDCRV